MAIRQEGMKRTVVGRKDGRQEARKGLLTNIVLLDGVPQRGSSHPIVHQGKKCLLHLQHRCNTGINSPVVTHLAMKQSLYNHKVQECEHIQLNKLHNIISLVLSISSQKLYIWTSGGLSTETFIPQGAVSSDGLIFINTEI